MNTADAISLSRGGQMGVGGSGHTSQIKNVIRIRIITPAAHPSSPDCGFELY
jgi:hypothetical protein